jgi:hypothetical protein
VLPPELAKANKAAKRNTLRDLASVIEQAAAAGEFRDVDARSTALAVIGMCNWVAWWADPNGRTDAGAVADTLADLAVAMVTSSNSSPTVPADPDAALELVRHDLNHLQRLLTTGATSRRTKRVTGDG